MSRFGKSSGDAGIPVPVVPAVRYSDRLLSFHLFLSFTCVFLSIYFNAFRGVPLFNISVFRKISCIFSLLPLLVCPPVPVITEFVVHRSIVISTTNQRALPRYYRYCCAGRGIERKVSYQDGSSQVFSGPRPLRCSPWGFHIKIWYRESCSGIAARRGSYHHRHCVAMEKQIGLRRKSLTC